MTEQGVEGDGDKKAAAQHKENAGDKTPCHALPTTPLSESPKQACDAARTNEQSGRENPDQLQRSSNWPPLWHLILEAFIGLAIVGATVAQVVVGQWQWSATHDQYRIMKDTAENQLRAYVIPIESSLRYGKRAYSANIVIKNSGQTPAYKIVSRSAIIYKPLDYSGPFKLTKENSIAGSGMTAGPGRAWTIVATRALSDSEYLLAMEGKIAVWTFGEIQYSDAFGKRRYTSFRFRQGEKINDTTYVMTFQDEGNDSN